MPTLAGPHVRAWPTVELEFDEPIFFCSWTKDLPAGRARGTALVMFEHDLRRWTSAESDVELRFLKLGEPTDQGSWSFREIRCVWEQQTSNALVFEDVDGDLHTLSATAPKPTVAGIPLWTRHAASNVVPLVRDTFLDALDDEPKVGS